MLLIKKILNLTIIFFNFKNTVILPVYKETNEANFSKCYTFNTQTFPSAFHTPRLLQYHLR